MAINLFITKDNYKTPSKNEILKYLSYYIIL